MNNKLWLLKGIGDHFGGYDCAYGFVIRAPTAIQARTIASENAGDEGNDAWLNNHVTSCIKLESNGPTDIILRDFNAG